MKLMEVISLYLTYKRSLGYRFKAEEFILRAFSKMTGEQDITTINEDKLLAFLNNTGQITETWMKKYRVLSGLYQFALARGLVNASPLPRTIPKPAAPAFLPYIYTHQELKRLLDSVPYACTPRASIEGTVFKSLLLLLYGTGLRLGEALALTLDDIDLSNSYLIVRETKFFKSRLVPLGSDLAKVLNEYIAEKCNCHAAIKTTFLFCSRNGAPLSQSAVGNAFRRLRLHAKVFRESSSYQPRIHDLRHTAALHRLIAWYRNSDDLQSLLPKLATYLGHVNLSSTQHYLTMTTELLREASIRFESYAMGGYL
jgi:integrase/recombinase XerD